MDYLLEVTLNKLFSETLPVFKENNDDKNEFILKTFKDDLFNYLIYNSGCPEAEVENVLMDALSKIKEDILEEIKAWLKVWYSKWIERTQIITSKQFGDMNTRLSRYVERSVTIEIPPNLQYELEKASRETLIKNNEYACTNIMAKDLVMYALRHEYKSIMEISKLEDQIRLMNVVIRRTNEISHTTGKLVFIRARS